MKKVIATLLALGLVISISAGVKIDGGKVTFKNITAPTELDTLGNNDTMVCVIDQVVEYLLQA